MYIIKVNNTKVRVYPQPPQTSLLGLHWYFLFFSEVGLHWYVVLDEVLIETLRSFLYILLTSNF